MMRLANITCELFELYASLVKGLSDYHPVAAHLIEVVDIADGRYAAARDQLQSRNRQIYLFIQSNRRPLHRTVFADVGDERLFDAAAVIFGKERDQFDLGRFLPAVDGELISTHVGTEQNAVAAEMVEPLEKIVRLGDGDAAEIYHLGPGIENSFYV